MKTFWIIAVLVFALSGCLPAVKPPAQPPPPVSGAASIDLQGHRGARGLLPENTILAFMAAMDWGVTTLEMDLAINRDGQAVLSHEPWMSAEICSHPDLRPVTKAEEKQLKIFEMNQQQIGRHDCGSRGNGRFPRQQAVPASKPLLSEVLQAVVARESMSNEAPVLFNIEIKTLPETDGQFHPEPRVFAEILYAQLRLADVLERSTVQSFDARALEAIHAIDPAVTTAWLIGEPGSFEDKLAQLSFAPDIYSPHYQLLDRDAVAALQDRGMRVIPWTVNERDTMRRLLEWGVDGLITDYPDVAVEVLADLGIAVMQAQ